MRKTKIIIGALALIIQCSVKTEAQTVTTIAGTGTVGFSGDGGPATAAVLKYPWGLAINRGGDLFFTDNGNNRVRKISASGIISTIGGTGVAGFSGDGGPATNATFQGVAGVAADKFGNIYVSDNVAQRVRKIDALGNISTVAGTGMSGDLGNGGPATAAQVSSPNEVAVDTFGNVYIPEQGSHRIQKINSAGIIITVAGTGVAGWTGDGGPATAAQINFPNDVFIDDAGNIYFTEHAYNIVRMINTAGIISTVAGNGGSGFSGDGGPATNATFNHLGGILADKSGQVIFCDVDNNRVREIDLSGQINTIAGNGTAGYIGDGMLATATEFNRPHKPVMDKYGNMYINDINNCRIRKITPSNNAPAFQDGSTKSITACEETTLDISSFLSINDPDVGQTETWSAATAPLHGTLAASYSTLSTGSIVTPLGIMYTPTGSYTGTDVFSIQISDGITTTTATVNVMISAKPSAGIIAGIDSVCPGKKITLTDGTSGGSWSSSNTLVAKIDLSGIATGSASGLDTILYTVNVDGCISIATFPVKVRTTKECSLGVAAQDQLPEGINVFPNPSSGSFDLYLATDNIAPATIVVYNITGSKVAEYSGASNKHINVQLTTPPGIYVLKAFTDKKVFTSKIIIGAE